MRKKSIKIYKSKWHLIFTFFVIILPFAFLLIFSQLADIATTKLFTNVFISFLRLLIAYIIAAVLAWILAIIFYNGKRADIALPIFDVLQSFPTFAILPVITFFFATSNAMIIFFLILTIIWPILFSIFSSLKLIKHEWEEAATIFQLKKWNYIKYFIFPISIPGLITGSIIGLGEGWEALIATEIIVNSKNGLGNFFQTFSNNPIITAFGILGFLIIIFSVNKLIWLPLMQWSHKKMEE